MLIGTISLCICPQGHTSQSWHLRAHHYNNPVIPIRFDKRDCLACSVRSQCTDSTKLPPVVSLKPQPLHQALAFARARQNTGKFKQLFSKPAGVESSLSQATRAFDLRRTRYIALAKTRLQYIATAAAINLSRMWAGWSDLPIGKTLFLVLRLFLLLLDHHSLAIFIVWFYPLLIRPQSHQFTSI